MAVDFAQIELSNAHDALQVAHQQQAIRKEFDALIKTKNWDLIPMPHDKKIASC